MRNFMLAIFLYFSSAAQAYQEDALQHYTMENACGSLCFGTCEDYSTRKMDVAKCIAINPESVNICKVMFGTCSRGKDKQCGWQNTNPSYAKCINDPASYSETYRKYMKNLTKNVSK